MAARESSLAEVALDLETCTLALPTGITVKFPLDAFARYCLLNGVDELGLMSKEAEIRAREQRRG